MESLDESPQLLGDESLNETLAIAALKWVASGVCWLFASIYHEQVLHFSPSMYCFLAKCLQQWQTLRSWSSSASVVHQTVVSAGKSLASVVHQTVVSAGKSLAGVVHQTVVSAGKSLASVVHQTVVRQITCKCFFYVGHL